MLRFLVFSAVIALALAAPTDDGPIVPMLDGRIVGGSAVSINNYPYQLSMRFGSSHFCGASIISANWAVTAAHCVSGMSSSSITLRTGSSLANSGGTIHAVSRIVSHGSYNSRTIDYDVAVMQVSSSFNLGSSGTQRVVMASAGSTPSNGANAVVSGWGTTREGGSASNQLMAVTVPIVSLANCRSSYGTSSITARMVCAGVTSGGRDACQGDSGGPLVVGSSLVGIVSWGNGCARPNYPGVYASVGNLRSWITSQTGV